MHLLPRTESFFDTFDEQAKLLSGVANELVAMVDGKGDEERAARSIADETRCHELGEHLVGALRVTFLTPLDRDDLFELTVRVGRVATALGAATHVFASNGANTAARELTVAGRDATHALSEALTAMRDDKRYDLARERCDAARRAAREAEGHRREALRALIANEDARAAFAELASCDALFAIADRCREAADALEDALLDA